MKIQKLTDMMMRLFLVLGTIGVVFAAMLPAHAEYIDATEEPELPGIYEGKRDSFTIDNPPNYVVFNSIKDHPGFGNEFDFVSITDLSTGKCYRGDEILILKPNQTYRVEFFCRNDAVITTASAKHTAYDANALVYMPSTIQAGTARQLTVKLSSRNTVPEIISSSVLLEASQNLTIEYVADSAFQRYEEKISQLSHYRPHVDGEYAVSYTDLFRDQVDMVMDGWLCGGESATLRFDIHASLDEDALALSDDSDSTSDPKSPADTGLDDSTGVGVDMPIHPVRGDTPKRLRAFELIAAIGLLAALTISLANLYNVVKLRNAILLQSGCKEDVDKDSKCDWFEQSRNASAQDKDDEEESFSGTGQPDDRS